MTNTSLETLPPLYAVIDLGSNSFHMLITRQLAGSVQVVDKIKRKVRLASGLDENNILSEQAISRGLTCLRFFAERLQDIPRNNIKVVATATLRLAENSALFISEAEQILSHKITLLSGLEEAKNIYLGVAYTSNSEDKRLVLDIGGASTEIISGNGFSINKALSLDMGCVTFRQQYFSNDKISQKNFTAAITAAQEKIKPIAHDYKHFGWQCVLGGSGTMQALTEILAQQHKTAVITREFLDDIRERLELFDNIADIQIPGLTPERSPVIVSGLAILIALFEVFSIKQLVLSCGALREGLLYGMLPKSKIKNIRQQTIHALSQRFQVDNQHAQRVTQQVRKLFSQMAPIWLLNEDSAFDILIAASQLCEIGLLLEYKHHQAHSAYIITHADLVGFNSAERQLLVALVRMYKGGIDQIEVNNQTLTPSENTAKLLAILRISVILSQRRIDNTLPSLSITFTKNQINILLPKTWLLAHPLITDDLQREQQQLLMLNINIAIIPIEITQALDKQDPELRLNKL